MQIVNTKILYLIYRQVKFVYARRQKQKKQDTVKRRTQDYDGIHKLNNRGLTIVGPIQSQSSRSGAGLNDSEYDRDSDKMQHLQHFAGKMGARQQ